MRGFYGLHQLLALIRSSNLICHAVYLGLGVALFAPAGSFYAENMTKEEVAETWALLSLRQKWMYSVARLFPALLPSLMQKTLVEDNLSPIRTLGGPPIGSKVFNFTHASLDCVCSNSGVMLEHFHSISAI